MAGQLTFAHADLKALLEKAKAQWPLEIHTLYNEVTGPGFWIVGDQGVYLMHNGKSHEADKQPVVYARECNPDKLEFDDWWEAKNATFGGSDGVDFIDGDTIEKIVQMGDDMAIDFDRDQMTITGIEARKDAA